MTMKLVCEVMVNGVATLKTLTTVNTMDQGKLVQTQPGVGKPFMMFSSLPAVPIMADFTGAPIVSANSTENNTAIQGMLAEPEAWMAKLTFPS